LAKKKKESAGRLEDARARMYHDLIFESAEYVFGANGFESATMQDIAQEAGVSLKTLYATFPGKQELYDEIQRERGSRLVELVNQRLAEGGDALTLLRAVARANVEYLCEHKDWFQIHLQDRVPWALKPKAAHAVVHWEQGIGAIVSLIEEGARQGIFCDEDPWSLAMMMQSIVQVQVARAAERGEEDVERVVADVEAPLLRLVCSDPPEDLRASA
jgi:AcrR family transcriptional regulator